MFKLNKLILFSSIVEGISCNFTHIGINENNHMFEELMSTFGEIINKYYNRNGYRSVICIGTVTNEFIKKLISYNMSVVNLDNNHTLSTETNYIYKPNTIVFVCQDYTELSEYLNMAADSDYWNARANFIVYLHKEENLKTMAAIFFTFWWFQVVKLHVFHCINDQVNVYTYTPYAYQDYKLSNTFGCWSNIEMSITYRVLTTENVVCIDSCDNLSYRNTSWDLNVPTCISFNIDTMKINELMNYTFYIDLTHNMNGYPFATHVAEFHPFIIVNYKVDGTVEIGGSRGLMHSIQAEIMNYTFDIYTDYEDLKRGLSYDTTTTMVTDACNRKIEMLIQDIYLMLFPIRVDIGYPYRQSGVCLVTHMAGFTQSYFTLISETGQLLLLLALIFVLTTTLTLFTIYYNNKFHLHYIGKAVSDSIRLIFTVPFPSLYGLTSFRIFFIIAVWSFFTLNLSFTSDIMSKLTVAKRDKDIDTYEDIIASGYPIEGFHSPDTILPETNPINIKMNRNVKHISNLLDCIKKLKSDPKRVCMIDCAVGRHFALELLDENGAQYMHIGKSQIHSMYINTILQADSPIAPRIYEIQSRLVESGLYIKWSGGKYKVTTGAKKPTPLSMKQFYMFLYYFLILCGTSIIVFLIELCIKPVSNFFT